MLFLWFLKRFFHGFVFLSITSETRETISRKYLTTRYFPPYYFFSSFHFFFLFVLELFFLSLDDSTRCRHTHLFFSLKYYSSEKRFFEGTHAKKTTPLCEGLASLHFFWTQAIIVVLVLASNSQCSSKVPKRSIGLYEWSMALPSVFPVKENKSIIG